MEIDAAATPHPPIWYGVHVPDSAERAARRRSERGEPRPRARETRLSIDRYRAIWPQVRYATTVPFPKLGLGRFIVVAPTDAEALALARAAPIRSGTRASRICSGAMAARRSHPRPATFDLLVERGQGDRGLAAHRGDSCSRTRQTGCNYVVGQFAFGDLTRAECLQSIGLFAGEVMPAMRANGASSGDQELSSVAAQARG